MNKRKFIQKREKAWSRFEDLLKQKSRLWNSKRFANNAAEFSKLYREICHDLAMIRSNNWGEELARYVNNLVSRGHSAFYTSSPSQPRALGHFILSGFPRLFRKNVAYFFVACILFFVPGFICWGLVLYQPSFAGRVVSTDTLKQFDKMYGDEKLLGEGSSWDQFGDSRSSMAGFYINNNVGIALQCFAHGVLFGIGTIYVLLSNGITIGTVAGYATDQGYTERFFSFVVSHGSFELTAIAVAGGAGLMLANAIIHPGQRRRYDAFLTVGREAVQIAGGAAIMLLIAAGIEAYWSPAPLPAQLKYAVGGLLWLVVILYLTFAGRNAPETT